MRARRLGFLLPGAGMALLSAVVWRPPLGIVVNGAILGCITALLAVGIALVYRASRVVNFAQADLGAVPALLAVLLANARGWPLGVAVLCGIGAALLTGALTELLVVRRFFRAPRLIVTVATLGIAQLLLALTLFMPGWFGDLTGTGAYAPPLDVSFTVGDVRFGGNDVLVLLVTPATLVALAVFLRRSSLGTALRAGAESADRAALLGIDVKRLHVVVWAIAALLGFIALFLRAGVVGTSVGRVLGPTLLLRALAAAVIGRMERLPTIVSAAIGLGIVDQAVRFAWDRDPYRDAVVAVIVIVALLATRAGEARGGEASTWDAVREVRPVPRELAGLVEVRAARAVVVGLVGGFLVTLPIWAPVSRVHLAGAIAVFAIIALSLVVLTGWAGQASLGQMAVAGLGAAAGGAVTSRLGADLALGLLAGGAVGSVATIAVGLPALRARGLAFAVSTLAFAVVTWSYLLNPTFFGSSTVAVWDWLPGSIAERPRLFGSIAVESETTFYFVTLVALALSILAVRGLRASRTGRVLVGVRENERQAQAYGVSPVRAAALAFGISGFLAGFAGALFFHHQQGLLVSEFAPTASLQVFAMAVVGGLGSVGGVVLGAAYVRGVDWFLPSEWSLLATGAGLLGVLMLLPGGLGAALGDARDALLRRLAARKGIRVPSLVADTLDTSLEQAARRVPPAGTPTGADAAHPERVPG